MGRPKKIDNKVKKIKKAPIEEIKESTEAIIETPIDEISEKEPEITSIGRKTIIARRTVTINGKEHTEVTLEDGSTTLL